MARRHDDLEDEGGFQRLRPKNNGSSGTGGSKGKTSRRKDKWQEAPKKDKWK